MDLQVWSTISRLLDEALELPMAARADWVARLPPQYQSLKPRLQAMIGQAVSDDGDAFLAALPRLDLTALDTWIRLSLLKSQLSDYYRRQDRYKEALAVSEELHAEALRRGQAGSLTDLVGRNNIAINLSRLGEHAAAHKIYRDLLAWHERGDLPVPPVGIQGNVFKTNPRAYGRQLAEVAMHRAELAAEGRLAEACCCSAPAIRHGRWTMRRRRWRTRHAWRATDAAAPKSARRRSFARKPPSRWAGQRTRGPTPGWPWTRWAPARAPTIRPRVRRSTCWPASMAGDRSRVWLRDRVFSREPA
jgi:hypothetical protein